MFKSRKLTRPMLHAAGSSLVLLSIAAIPLQTLAQGDHHHGAVESNDQLTVVRDAGTGKLRAPTADERSVMQEKAAKRHDARIAPPRMQQKWHHSGAIGTRVTDEFMSTSVAVRQPDGSVVQQCFDSRDKAAAALTSAGMAVPAVVSTSATE